MWGLRQPFEPATAAGSTVDELVEPATDDRRTGNCCLQTKKNYVVVAATTDARETGRHNKPIDKRNVLTAGGTPSPTPEPPVVGGPGESGHSTTPAEGAEANAQRRSAHPTHKRGPLSAFEPVEPERGAAGLLGDARVDDGRDPLLDVIIEAASSMGAAFSDRDAGSVLNGLVLTGLVAPESIGEFVAWRIGHLEDDGLNVTVRMIKRPEAVGWWKKDRAAVQASRDRLEAQQRRPPEADPILEAQLDMERRAKEALRARNAVRGGAEGGSP